MTTYIDLLAAHDKLEAQNTELLGILSRLQSEHCDLIEREHILESRLAAVPRYAGGRRGDGAGCDAAAVLELRG